MLFFFCVCVGGGTTSGLSDYLNFKTFNMCQQVLHISEITKETAKESYKKRRKYFTDIKIYICE